MAMRYLQQVGGALIIVAILVDVFLTVLYARMQSGFLSPRVARAVWVLFRMLARSTRANPDRLLSFCGPVILVVLLFLWIAGLMLGNALIMHPLLGSAIRSTNGHTPTDFISALYAGGNSVSIVGSSDFSPANSGARLLYLFNSIAGLSVTSLTLTYLMQVYTQLQQRNAFALKVYLGTARTGDAAEMLAGIAPRGEWSHGTSILWEMSAEIAVTKEAHHFYPVLFYMRFPEHYYSLSFATLVLLDMVSLIRAGLPEDAAVIKELGALDELWDGSLLLLTNLQGTFLSKVPEPRPPDAEQRARWERRLDAGLDRLQKAGISTCDRVKARAAYVEFRSQWNAHIYQMAPSMMYNMDVVDTATRGQA